MRTKLKQVGMGACGLLGSLWLASAALATSPSSGGLLTVGVNSDIESTEFATKHDEVTAAVLHHVYEGLVAFRDDLSVAPMLAERFEVSPDGKTYTFVLREGLKFHNGAPVTVADVKWSWDRFRDPKRDWGSHCREWYDGSAEGYHRPAQIVSIDTPDARTIVFKLAARNVLFLDLMANNHCITGIIHKESLNADGSWNRPVATGPFMLKEWRKGQYVELARFPGYRPRSEDRTGMAGNKAAHFDTIRFVPVTDAKAARDALVSGKVDAWIDVPWEIQEDLAARSNIKLQHQDTPAWQVMMMQTRTDPLLRDPRMRQAISHSVDPDRVAREVLGEHGKGNPSAVALRSTFHTAVHDQAIFDVAKAKALLREVGYKGEPVRIQASKTPFPTFFLAAQSVAKMMQEAGINAIVEDTDWETLVEKNYEANTFQMASMAYSLRTDPTLMYSAIIGQKSDHGWYLWESTEAAALAAYSSIVEQRAERQEIFDYLHRNMLDWVPMIGLYNFVTVTATNSKLVGFETWPLGLPRYWGVQRTK